MHFIRAYLPYCLLAFLAACASLPPPTPNTTDLAHHLHQQHQASLNRIGQFELKGRLGVQADGKGFSGNVHWQHSADLDDIRLYSPLGGQVASIKKTASGIVLEDGKGQQISGTDAESLMQSVLGWRLPLNGLADWVLGRPTSHSPASQLWDEQGHCLSLNQSDWAMEYQNYAAASVYVLPHKIALKNQRVQLKLLVEKWTME